MDDLFSSVRAGLNGDLSALSSVPPGIREALKACRGDEEGRAHIGDVMAHYAAAARSGLVTIAPKEIYPATVLLDMAMAEAGSVDLAETMPPGGTVVEDPVTVNLWELALKLRMNEVYARASAGIKFKFRDDVIFDFLTVCVVRSRSCDHSCLDKFFFGFLSIFLI